MRDYLLTLVIATLCAALLQFTGAHAVPPPPAPRDAGAPPHGHDAPPPPHAAGREGPTLH